MELPVSSRTYGSLLDGSSSKHVSGSPQKANDSLSRGQDAVHRHPRATTRNWLTVAIICAMGVGTIMATSRGRPASTSLTPTTPLSGKVSSDASDVPKGATGNSLLAAKLRKGIAEPEADLPHFSSAVPALDYSVSNFYHDRDGKPGALVPWLQNVKLAEPYRDTFMRVANPREGHTYSWAVHAIDGEQELLATATGSEAVMQFTRLDNNAVTLVEVSESSGQATRELRDTVMVKYVRREIRTLTDAEREELLDAMSKLWTDRVDGGNGTELYGDDYADIWAINRLHFKAASPYACDHFHDGLGFLTSHTLLTNTFEYSLQRVNPKLTLPYWDFTIETTTVQGDPDVIEPQAQSPLLQPSWFGSNDPLDGMLKNGRWAYTEIPPVKINNPADIETDVYSKLRAPWNVNHRAYLSRGLGDMCGFRSEEFYEWPTCSIHYDLTTQYSDFYSWVWYSLYDPHGPVHIWLGGVMDCSATYSKITDLVGPLISNKLAYLAFVHRKNLYRSGLWRCEGTTDIDTLPEEVMQSKLCGCLDYDLTQGDDYLILRDQIVSLTTYIEDFDEDVQREVVATLCNGIMNDGDHLQASSSLDPTFWVTHPTMERLWMFKRLTGTMTDLSWPDEDVEYVDSTTGKTVVESLSLYSEDCNGHRGKDVFPFGLASDDGDPGFMARTGIRGDNDGGNTLSNREILLLLDPRFNGLNYIYDTFEWSHCREEGLDFNDAFTEARTGSNRPTFNAGEMKYPRYSAFDKMKQEKRQRE